MGERTMLMYNILLQDGVKGKLDCSLCPGKWYFIRRAYHLLSFAVQTGRSEYYDTVWRKWASLKVFLLTQRLVLNRLPTKDNLIFRGIIRQTSDLCSSGCG